MVYCERCDRYFRHHSSFEQHRRSSSYHYVCYQCDRDFTSRDGLIQHFVQSPVHSFCQRCEEHFDDDDDLETHYEDVHWYCTSCRRGSSFEPIMTRSPRRDSPVAPVPLHSSLPTNAACTSTIARVTGIVWIVVAYSRARIT